MKGNVCWIAALQLLLLSVICKADFDPYSPGPYTPTNFTLDRTFIIGLPENLAIWSPVEAGNYPVVYLLGGLDMILPGGQYSEVASGITSYGYVVVVMWKVLSPVDPADKLPLFTDTVDWCQGHLENNLHKHNISEDVHVDFTQSLAMSHSAGSHTMVDYLKIQCGNFKALAMMSPVDGADPFGILGSFAITPGEYLNFDIPTYILAAGLDSVPAAGVVVSCSPEELGSSRFWAALQPESRRWIVNSTEFGHNDFMDHILSEDYHPCSSHGGTHEEYVLYRHFVVGQVVSFYKAVLKEDCTPYLHYIEELESMPIATTGDYYDVPGCPIAQCLWTEPPSTTAAPVTGSA